MNTKTENDVKTVEPKEPKKADKQVEAEPVLFECVSLKCGHSIAAYPCPYCGFAG